MHCFRHSPSSFLFTYLGGVVYLGILVANVLSVTSFAGEPAAEGKKPAKPDEKKVIVCFDGKSLDGWKVANFGGEGEVTVKDGAIVMEYGYSLTGVTYDRPVPNVNYEVSLEAARLDGIDFFCCLTFPVDDSACSLVVGGWAGVVVGLSNIDGRDASENETTQYISFKDKQWYKIRVRVTEKKIEAWIDDKQIVNVARKGRKFDTRVEVELCKPFGIAAWETRSGLRNIRFRKL